MTETVILGVYVDSWAFVFSSTVLQSSLGLDSSHNACDAAILLCLVCYLTSKVGSQKLISNIKQNTDLVQVVGHVRKPNSALS